MKTCEHVSICLMVVCALRQKVKTEKLKFSRQDRRVIDTEPLCT
jgi:hypothetical protein